MPNPINYKSLNIPGLTIEFDMDNDGKPKTIKNEGKYVSIKLTYDYGQKSINIELGAKSACTIDNAVLMAEDTYLRKQGELRRRKSLIKLTKDNTNINP